MLRNRDLNTEASEEVVHMEEVAHGRKLQGGLFTCVFKRKGFQRCMSNVWTLMHRVSATSKKHWKYMHCHRAPSTSVQCHVANNKTFSFYTK